MGNLIKKSKYTTGYLGVGNTEFQEFIRTKPNNKHLLFLKPSKNLISLTNAKTVKKWGDVNVVILGTVLPKDLISFVLENEISAFVNPKTLTANHIIEITSAITEKGYFANKNIPEGFWLDKKPHVFPRPKPFLTITEEEVLKLLCHNFTVKEISVKLDKNEPAIRAHIANLREKLYAKSLLEIVVITMANMWITIDPKLTSSNSPFL